MKFFYAIMILTRLALAFLFRNENQIAYLLYLWNNLSGTDIQVGRNPIKPGSIFKHKASRSNTGDTEYSLFLER